MGHPFTLADSMDPGWRGRMVYALMKYSRQDDWDDRPRGRKPGDKYVVVGAAVGMVTGGAFGFSINFFVGLLGIVAGGVVGALAGSLIASLIRRQRKGRIRKNSQ